jgi:hypothetical protein
MRMLPFKEQSLNQPNRNNLSHNPNLNQARKTNPLGRALVLDQVQVQEIANNPQVMEVIRNLMMRIQACFEEHCAILGERD